MSDSVEYRSLVKCRDKLVTAFKLDAVTVANCLVSSNLIPPAISSEIGELATSERKASRLVDCIFAKVEISHTHYSSFVTVFSQFGWLSDIVEILNSTHRELLHDVGTKDTLTEVTETALESGQRHEEKKEILQIHPQAVAVPSTAASENTGRSSQVHSEIGIAVISSNEERIKAMFSALLLNVQAVLEANGVAISRVRQFLVNFLHIEDCFPESISRFDKLFIAVTLNDLWSYQHYSPLERLTDHFLPDDPKIKGFMRDYKSQLAGFFLTTKLVDYIEYQQLQADESDDDSEQQSSLKKYTTQHYRKIKIRLEMKRKVSELSLGYVQILLISLAEEYELPSLTAIIDTIVDGSLEIAWLLPSHIAEMIKPRSKFFRKLHIVQVFLDDVKIYDEKEMATYEKRFLEICKTGTADISEFSHLLSLGVDPDLHDKNGFHPLWYASYNARADLVQLLIEYQADVNLAMNDNKFGQTVLLNSCSRGHTEIARILVKNGANIHYMDKNGQSPLWMASYYGHSTIVLLLLQHNAQVDLPNNDEHGETALFAASAFGHLQTATLLLQHGAVVNYQSKLGTTPLFFACKEGHYELVDLLLSQGAEVNKGQQAPLFAACQLGRVQIVRRLIQRGADVNLPVAEDEFGSTPLGTACIGNYIDVATVLIDSGAFVDSQDKKGMSALHLSCDEGNTDIVKLLLKCHAKLEITNNEGRTALMVACWRGHLMTVMELLRAGAKTDTQDQEGLISLMLAIQNGHVDVVKALLDAKANPNISDKSSAWTAVFFAAKMGSLKMVQLLTARGAQVDIKDKNDVTTFDIAKLNGHQDICEELEKHTSRQSETKTEITEDQEKRVKKSYQRLLRIFDFLEETLLRGRKEKRLHQTVQKGVSSNIIEASQQQVDNDNI